MNLKKKAQEKRQEESEKKKFRRKNPTQLKTFFLPSKDLIYSFSNNFMEENLSIHSCLSKLLTKKMVFQWKTMKSYTGLLPFKKPGKRCLRPNTSIVLWCFQEAPLKLERSIWSSLMYLRRPLLRKSSKTSTEHYLSTTYLGDIDISPCKYITFPYQLLMVILQLY